MNNHPPYNLQFHLEDLPPFAILHGLQPPRMLDHVFVDGLTYCVLGVCWIYPSTEQPDTPTTIEVKVDTNDCQLGVNRAPPPHPPAPCRTRLTCYTTPSPRQIIS
jgi:hypothetical protein